MHLEEALGNFEQRVPDKVLGVFFPAVLDDFGHRFLVHVVVNNCQSILVREDLLKVDHLVNVQASQETGLIQNLLALSRVGAGYDQHGMDLVRALALHLIDTAVLKFAFHAFASDLLVILNLYSKNSTWPTYRLGLGSQSLLII